MTYFAFLLDLLVENNSRLNDIMSAFQLHNVITEPTRIGNTRQSLLDPVLVSECSVGFSEVVDIDRSISDHNATVVEIDINSGTNKCSTRKIWLYELGDYDQFCTKLDNINWEDLLLEPTVDEACEIFTNIFIIFASETIPTKDVTIRPNDKPWFNSQLRREMRKRDRLRKKAKTGNFYHVNKYKKQRNHVNNLKKTIKQEFYADAYGLVDQFACYNQKGFWKLVKMLIKTSGKSEIIPPLLNPVTQTIETGDKEKANLLNEYFVSISTMDDNGIDLPEMEYRTEEILHDINIDTEAVLDILKILKIGKASGADKISHQMLKYTANSVARPLMILFNKCLECGIFPQTWKKAIVIPLYKKDDKHLPSNYRPISLLSCVGKVFERIISYLDLLLSIGRDGQLRTSLYDKRDDFNFHITNFPFLSSNIPSSPAYGVFISQLIRYARACSSYECFILRAMRLSNKLLGQGYVKERLKSSLRKFYGRYGDLTKQYEVPLSRMLHDILDDDHIQ